jgi:hypothetical protein
VGLFSPKNNNGSNNQQQGAAQARAETRRDRERARRDAQRDDEDQPKKKQCPPHRGPWDSVGPVNGRTYYSCPECGKDMGSKAIG